MAEPTHIVFGLRASPATPIRYVGVSGTGLTGPRGLWSKSKHWAPKLSTELLAWFKTLSGPPDIVVIETATPETLASVADTVRRALVASGIDLLPAPRRYSPRLSAEISGRRRRRGALVRAKILEIIGEEYLGTDKDLAEALGLKKRQVGTYLSELVKCGMLSSTVTGHLVNSNPRKTRTLKRIDGLPQGEISSEADAYPRTGPSGPHPWHTEDL